MSITITTAVLCFFLGLTTIIFTMEPPTDKTTRSSGWKILGVIALWLFGSFMIVMSFIISSSVGTTIAIAKLGGLVP